MKQQKIPLSIEAFTLLSLALPEYKKGSDFTLRTANNEYSLVGVLIDLYDIRFAKNKWVLNRQRELYEYDPAEIYNHFWKWAFGSNFSLDKILLIHEYSENRATKHKTWPSSSQLKKTFWFDPTDAERRRRNRKPNASKQTRPGKAA